VQDLEKRMFNLEKRTTNNEAKIDQNKLDLQGEIKMNVDHLKDMDA